MALKSFAPNTVIKSSDVTSNFTNFLNNALHFTAKWTYGGGLALVTLADYISLQDAATINRVDIVVGTAPTGAAIIVDIEKSTDGGTTWNTIFTGGTNRPQIAASAKTGNTISIDVAAVTAFTDLFRPKISQVGSIITGSDLSIMMRGEYNLD